MMFPCLVKKEFCKTPVKVVINSDELNEDGEFAESVVIDTFCNLQMGAKVSFAKNKEKVELSGVALFIGDLAPGLNNISSGSVFVNGAEYDINAGRKNYNPDSTVNYTTLELI